MIDSDLVEKVARAIWGTSSSFQSFDDASTEDRDEARGDACAAIAAVLDDLMEPTEATLRAVDAAAMDKWPNAKRMAYAMHKAIVTAKLKELGLSSPEKPQDKP